MLKPIRTMMHAALIAALALGGLTAVDAVSSPAAQAIGEDTFTNPLAPDTADPTIEFHDGNYYMVATTWDNKVVMRKAPTLAGLGTTKPVTVYSDTNAGRNGNMWAPELQRLEGPNGWRWYLMYTMGASGNFGTQHLQVIESAADDPMGPYTYKGRPIPTDDWNIDGAYLKLNGELFVTWSAFAPDGLQSNYIARMTDPWTAVGPLNILSQPTEPWEVIGQPVNEGPVPLQKDGKTWIVYSASFCGTEDYQLGTLEYLGGDPVLSASWQKSDGPVFSKANGAYGTGHNDFFNSPDDTETWNLYHANARPNGGCSRERSARAQVVDWSADGEPDFGIPQATSTQVRVPSGENAPITAQVEGGRWNLVSRTTGLCATVGSDAAGAGVVQGACSSSRARFVLDTTGDGYLRVVNAVSGASLGPAECSTAESATVLQTPFLTTGCQQWTAASTTGGWSKLTNRTSGKVLDAGAGTAAGAALVQSTANATAGQDWALRPAGQVVVTSIVSGKSFDLPNCSTADGAVLQQREYLAAPCQSVSFTAAANGESELHLGSAPEKCLAVAGGSTADSVAVTQGPCGVAGSTWRVLVGNDGTVEFRNGTSLKALDLSFCATADGTRVHQYSVLNNDCQRFRIASVAADPVVVTTPALEATATTRCVAGKAVVAVKVRNADEALLAVTSESAYGEKSFELGAGASRGTSFSTRAASIAAGSVTVTATDPADASRTTTVTAEYAATSC